MAAYICDITGLGTDENPYRPAIAEYVPVWTAVDGREDATLAAGVMLVFCDPTPEQAAAFADDDRIELFA